MEILQQKLIYLQEKVRAFLLSEGMDLNWRRLKLLLVKIKSIGMDASMDEYESRKLAIFNLLNFFQFISGVLLPLIGFLTIRKFSTGVWLISCLPAFVSLVSLYLNHRRNHLMALLAYFILYPFFTCVVYINGINLGVDLCFILFGILAVFFLQDIGYMLFAIAFSMLSYFILAVVLKDFRYDLSEVNQPFYLFNQLLFIAFIYYGLWLIKRENTSYQFHILQKSRSLHKQNLEIEQQKKVIAEKARKLSVQTKELTELNNVKNKLFSIISHDLKLPMYALRNLFQNVQQQSLPADELKEMLPDVVQDLNYTISLMENLLQWAKSQMQADMVRTEHLDIAEMIDEVVHLLRSQAENKKIKIVNESMDTVQILGDRDMINLVLRNLLSNAIKFTPESGHISIGFKEGGSFVEVYVKDSGAGMGVETLNKISQNNYYTTKGTASESGTGLGLMLCKEFLAKNGGHLHIESKLGEGSIFSFIMPRAA
jgi:signal transduction histidine kinase